MAQHWSYYCWRLSDWTAGTGSRSQNGGSDDQTVDVHRWSGIFNDRTNNTDGQNDIFGYRTSGTCYGASSLATELPTPVSGEASFAIRPLEARGVHGSGQEVFSTQPTMVSLKKIQPNPIQPMWIKLEPVFDIFVFWNLLLLILNWEL